MGGYNSCRFTKEFSQRTEDNLDYIIKTVHRDSLEQEYRDEFIKKYQNILDEVETIVSSLRIDANAVPTMQKKGRNELKSHLHSVASRLDSSKKQLEEKLKDLDSTNNIPGNKLYEVTQLINSMMGIAVLPYEMHKEYFKLISEVKHPEDNRDSIREDIRSGPEYDDLLNFIRELYRDKKWKTTYKRDLREKNGIREDVIVFQFLRHLRNTVCHSGDDAISILPLDDGQVIREVLFYDTLGENEEIEEFAMRLTIEEVQKLIRLVADFYKNSKVGST